MVISGVGFDGDALAPAFLGAGVATAEGAGTAGRGAFFSTTGAG